MGLFLDNKTSKSILAYKYCILMQFLYTGEHAFIRFIIIL